MKTARPGTSVSLCLSTVLTAVLMCLLNGEHYASQLESAWPVARPLAALMSKASEYSGLPHLHALCRDAVDSCCLALWRERAEEEAEPPAPQEAPPPAPSGRLAASPQPQGHEFRDFHTNWLAGPYMPEYEEFCDFHKEWLGGPSSHTREFCGFHGQWLGLAEAEKLVDTCPVSCRVMLMGDSLMEDFGVTFYRHFKTRRGLQMILLAKFSTGLCRPDYFNWFEMFPRTLDEKAPHLVIFMLGANDCLPVWYSKGNSTPTKPADKWKEAYGERVGMLLSDARNRRVLPLWVGMPIMGGKHAALHAQTEEATREACAGRGVPYRDNRALLADENGQYQSFIKDNSGKVVRVRAKDKQHMSPEGNRMLLQAALPDFEQVLRQHRLAHPELCVYPEQEESLPKPTLDVVIPYKPR